MVNPIRCHEASHLYHGGRCEAKEEGKLIPLRAAPSYVSYVKADLGFGIIRICYTTS